MNQNSQTDQSPVLNVILHGAFAFARKPDGIDAMIPAMKHHVYRAGNWLGETELRGRGATYDLLGVQSGDKDLDPDLNVRVKSNLPNETPVHATLRLPKPKSIRSLRVAEVPLKSFKETGDLLEGKDPMRVATLQIFSYDVLNENQLFLRASRGDGHYWEPISNKGFINLHVFAAEDHFARLSNSEEDFNRCVAVLGSKLRLDTRLVPTGIPNPGDLPPGVTEVETETLAIRNRRLARLGRLVTQKGDANMAWYGNDSLDGDPQGCGGCTN